jgi:hypothetical protein
VEGVNSKEEQRDETEQNLLIKVDPEVLGLELEYLTDAHSTWLATLAEETVNQSEYLQK